MWVTTLLAPQLSTLYSNVSSSYMKYRSDATSFPFCLISVSSHHSHYLPPWIFSALRCTSRASLCSRLKQSLTCRSAPCCWDSFKPFVALTPASPFTQKLAADTLLKKKTYFSFQPPCALIASPPPLVARQQPPAIHKRSHVYKLHPAKVRRLSLQLDYG